MVHTLITGGQGESPSLERGCVWCKLLWAIVSALRSARSLADGARRCKAELGTASGAERGEEQPARLFQKRRSSPQARGTTRGRRAASPEGAELSAGPGDLPAEPRPEATERERGERFRRIVENMNDLVCLLDVEGRYEYLSPSYRYILAYEPEALLGEWAFARVHPDDRDRVIAKFRDSMIVGQPTQAEFRYRHAAGHYVWFQSNGGFLRDAAGKVVGTVVTSREITDRKLAKDALQESEKRYRTVSELISDYAFSAQVDAEGHTQGDWVAGAFERITGYSWAEFQALGGWTAILHPEDIALDQRDIAQLLTNQPVSSEIRIVTRDGETRWVHVFARPVWDDHQGRVTQLIGAVQDVTARRQAERVQAAIYRISEAAHTTQDLGELFAAIHKIVGELMPARNFYIALYDAYADLFDTPYLVDELGLPPPPYKPGKGLAAYVFRSGEPLLASPEILRHLLDTGQVEVIGRSAVDWLGVPLKTQRGTIGVMAVYSYEEAERLKESDKDILAFVSTQAAMAIERKQAEEALREASLVIENSPAVLFRWRAAEGWPVEMVSDNVRQFGYTPEELLSGATRYASLVHPDDLLRVSQEIEGFSARGVDSFQQEYRIQTKGGEVRWLDDRTVIERDARGRITHYQGITVDITARRQAELALQESNATLNALIQCSPAAIIALDTAGLVTLWNPAAEGMFGWSEKEVLNRLDPLFPQGERSMLAARLPGRQEQVSSAELRCWRKDGTQVDVSLSVGPLWDASGRVSGSLGIFVDISERVRAERLLRTLDRAALALAQALTPEEIFAAVTAELKELDFSCLLFPLDESRTRLLPKYVGYESEDLQALEHLMGSALEDFAIPVETAEVLKEIIWQKKTIFSEAAQDLLQQVLPQPAKMLNSSILGALAGPRFIGAPLIVQNEVIGALFVQSDGLAVGDTPAITAFAHQVAAAWRKVQLLRDLERSLEELKQTQEQLLQAQKMEAIGRLAGGVAHDFNNLLTAILGYVEFLLFRIQPADPLRNDALEIKKATQRAATLTDQLLAFSRKQVLRPKVLNFNLVVANIEQMLRRLLGDDIELVTRLDPELGWVLADPGQVDQVILNLAVNARDAMVRGGRLTLETKDTYLDEDYCRLHAEVQAGPYVLLTVSDTGTGMDKETQSHLFEPFFTTKEVGKGTGLGLATVYGIVKQSGGHIAVHSEPERGTTFKIYLPRVEQTAVPEARLGESAALPRGGETILVVEDAEAVRGLIHRTLSQSGYTVLEAGDGEEALRLCQEHRGPIDMLLTDVVMPRVDGRQLAEQACRLRPGMKVLYTSGYTDEAIVQRGGEEPEVVFLQKPFSPAELAQKVREVMDAGHRKAAGSQGAEGQGKAES